MRLRHQVAAIAAAIFVLAVAPSGAFARKHNPFAGTGPCSVNINAVPRLFEEGETVSVFGRLSCRTLAAESGRVVTLYEKIAGSGKFTAIGTASTEAGGFYELTTPPVVYNSVFYVRARGIVSGRSVVKVLAHVTFSGPAEGTQLFTGPANKVIFSGVVSPADTGAVVVLQRQNAVTGNEWHRIQRGFVGPGGVFSLTHVFAVPGDANIRVLIRSHGRNVPSPSDLTTYEISQTENPALTIGAAPDPIVYGHSTLISGTLSGASTGMPVTLYAHTAHQKGFAPVAETKTGSGGAYAFAPQSPVASTYYQVKGGSQASAILFEGVIDVITATPLPTTVAAGQPFTVTGTVSPDHTGHIIYLQQANRFGGGFHTVAVSTVGAGSAYSFSHSVYTVGTPTFRVRIPGGPLDEGAASKPFTITVTPAPATALKPESSSNVGQPAEGQT